ncbi:MAG: MerR family transcriptional regulator [Myxococcaceae bacterium]|nr:MerR family transcriptional regulator [Myxococcaceae bacterium]
MATSPTPLRLRIGAFARKTGLSRDTIRFYERKGLLVPTVEANGYRTFDQRAVERAQAIQVAQGLGFSLGEIGRTIGEWELKGLTRAQRLKFIDEKTGELAARIAQLERMKRYLEQKGAWIRAGEHGVPPLLVDALTGPGRRRAGPVRRPAVARAG